MFLVCFLYYIRVFVCFVFFAVSGDFFVFFLVFEEVGWAVLT